MTIVPKLDIAKVQAFLAENALDGWLIYDFFGINKVAEELFDLADRLLTRRWLYFIPQQGTPTLVVHKIETVSFPKVPGKMLTYAGRQELLATLSGLLQGVRRIAMEYSPDNDIPTVSYVDAGTMEMLRRIVPEVVSSANLVQYFTCRLSADQLESHKKAALVLHEAQRQAFQFIEAKLRSQQSVTEYDVQQLIVEKIAENDCTAMSPAIVGVNQNASNPHYAPTASVFSPINKGDCILIDLWAKENTASAVYADITWIGFAGPEPPAQYRAIWQVVREARDLAVDFLQNSHKQGKMIRGYEVDEVVRKFIAAKGYGDYFFHRTGHSIGMSDHGKGVNIDSYETKDQRDIIPGLLFSIEPGIYLPQFGVRTEIDVYFDTSGPVVYTPAQKEIVLLDV